MPKTTDNVVENGLEAELRIELDRLVAIDCGIHPGFSQAFEALVLATDYNDPTLIKSHLATALEFLQVFVQDNIQKMLVESQRIMTAWRKTWETVKKSPNHYCPVKSRIVTTG